MGGGTIVGGTIVFTQKWLDRLLLMTSYLITIATDHHWTCLKVCARDEWTATENIRCWCFIPKEKLRKTVWGGIHSPPPPLYVRALSHNFILTLIRKLSLRVSFFPVSLLAKSATSTHKIKRQTSYPCHMGVFPPSLPSPPTHLIIIVEVTELVLPLPREGILPVMAYTGRSCPKGVPFSGFRYMKG